MNQENFYRYLDEPKWLEQADTHELSELMQAFPYSGLLKLLYLQAMNKQKDILFFQELKRLAIAIPDRRLLHRMVTERKFSDRPFLMHNKEEEHDDFELIDAFLTSKGEQEKDLNLDVHHSVSSDYLFWLGEKGVEEDDLEWSNFSQEETSSPKTEKLRPQKQDEELSDSFFTETLAAIYIKQGRYDKALQIIHKLNLKFPEKSAYFADQIRFLEKLIINSEK